VSNYYTMIILHFCISNVVLNHKFNLSILIVADEDYSRNASSFVSMVTP